MKNSALMDELTADTDRLPLTEVEIVPEILDKVTQFPPSNDSGSIRLQDAVLSMLKRGEVITDIAASLGQDELVVHAIARSKWIEDQLSEWVSSEGEGSMQTLRTVMKSQAYEAIIQIGKLIKCENKTVALGACRLALEYTLTPAKELSLQKKKAEVPSSEVDRKAEYEATQAEIARLKSRNTI